MGPRSTRICSHGILQKPRFSVFRAAEKVGAGGPSAGYSSMAHTEFRGNYSEQKPLMNANRTGGLTLLDGDGTPRSVTQRGTARTRSVTRSSLAFISVGERFTCTVTAQCFQN